MAHVEDAGVLTCAGEALEARIEFAGVLFRELRNRTNTEKVEIVFDGRADGNKVTNLALCGHGGIPFISLYVRHDQTLYRRVERLQRGKIVGGTKRRPRRKKVPCNQRRSFGSGG